MKKVAYIHLINYILVRKGEVHISIDVDGAPVTWTLTDLDAAVGVLNDLTVASYVPRIVTVDLNGYAVIDADEEETVRYHSGTNFFAGWEAQWNVDKRISEWHNGKLVA